MMKSRSGKSQREERHEDDAAATDVGAPEATSEGDAQDGDVESPETAGLRDEQIAQLTTERDEAHGQYLRVLADYRNFQRRSIQNEQAASEQARIDMMRDLLPVLDSFDLALQHQQHDASPSAVEGEPLLKGVQMVRDLLHQALANKGLMRVDAEPGEDFDPTKHEAVMQEPTGDVDPGQVCRCVQVGYTLGDKVLRPAKVTLAREPDAE